MLFPHQFLTITVARDKSLKLLEEAGEDDNTVAILTQRDSRVENPAYSDLFNIGTVAKIMRTIDMPDGSKTILIQGQHRVNLITLLLCEIPVISIPISCDSTVLLINVLFSEV